MDVTSSIAISVMGDPTFGTGPMTDIQRQGVENMPTLEAAFGARIPAVNLDHGSSIPLRLIVELRHKLTPSDITDRLGKVSVAPLSPF
jgi:hypothetical protein